jgi:hypothetical protein
MQQDYLYAEASSHFERIVVTPALVEIVRLPVAAGHLGALARFLDGHPYFAQPELTAWRILTASDDSEVVLVIDWSAPGASERALTSPAGVALVDGLQALLSGPPAIAYYQGTP